MEKLQTRGKASPVLLNQAKDLFQSSIHACSFPLLFAVVVKDLYICHLSCILVLVGTSRCC
jgi:hypothetical protein